MSFYIDFNSYKNHINLTIDNCLYCGGEGVHFMDLDGNWLPDGGSIECEECAGTGERQRHVNEKDYIKDLTILMINKANYQGKSIFEEACLLFRFINSQGINILNTEYKGLDYKP